MNHRTKLQTALNASVIILTIPNMFLIIFASVGISSIETAGNMSETQINALWFLLSASPLYTISLFIIAFFLLGTKSNKRMKKK